MSTSDILRQIRGAITCGIWLCYSNMELLDASVLSFMSSLLIQMQYVAKTAPSWMELHGDSLPQYGIFGFMDGSHRSLDPILKRTTLLTPPDADAVAKVLFPQKWKGVIDFARTCWTSAVNAADGRYVVETLRQMYNVSQ